MALKIVEEHSGELLISQRVRLDSKESARAFFRLVLRYLLIASEDLYGGDINVPGISAENLTGKAARPL